MCWRSTQPDVSTPKPAASLLASLPIPTPNLSTLWEPRSYCLSRQEGRHLKKSHSPHLNARLGGFALWNSVMQGRSHCLSYIYWGMKAFTYKSDDSQTMFSRNSSGAFYQSWYTDEEWRPFSQASQSNIHWQWPNALFLKCTTLA